MTFPLQDDKTFRSRELRACGPMAALLSQVALFECAQVDGDGVLDAITVKDAANLYDIPRHKAHAAALVAAGIWHDADTLKGCDDCLGHTGTLERGSFLVHGWWRPLLSKAGKEDPVKRDRELRRKRIWRNKPLVLAVRTRDRDACRYCGVACSDPADPDKVAAERLTLDHVDPWGPDTAGNLVVACRRCNGIKRDRTPEEAGMVLLKPGTRADTRPDTDQTRPGGVGSVEQTPTRATRETGQGRHGPGPVGSVAGAVSGQIGPVPGPAFWATTIGNGKGATSDRV